jgi:uncharacterized protein
MFFDYRFYLFEIIVFLSAIMSTFSTFGFTALILLPLSLVFKLDQSIAISGIIDLFNGLTRGWFFRDKIDLRLVVYYGLPAIALALYGSLNIVNFDKSILQVMLGITLITYGIVKLKFHNFALPFKKQLLVIGGLISGALAGIFGAGGIFGTAFLSNYKLPVAEFIATCTVIEILIDLSRASGYVSTIPINREQWILIGISIIVSYLGVYIAEPFAKHISEVQFIA